MDGNGRMARLGAAWFTRKDYLGFFKTIGPATASRDLRLGAGTGRLERSGGKRLARYRFIKGKPKAPR